MRLLIYGAGVIGCLYASLFSEAGYDVTIYARGKRLESLQKNGLIYQKKKTQLKAKVSVIGELKSEDAYDFIFLTVKENQVHQALRELKENSSPTIVTMVNSLEPHEAWEDITGKGRILPAFPGAGGSFKGDVLEAALTPWIVQPTTFAELDGKKSDRTKQLATIFKKSKIPYQIVTDMHVWQLCHLAMVVPIADAYYEAENPAKAGLERKLMKKTAERMRRNYRDLHKFGMKLSPKKMNLFRIIPISLLSVVLGLIFRSDLGDVFMYQHSMKAPDEMRQLHNQFYEYMSKKAGA